MKINTSSLSQSNQPSGFYICRAMECHHRGQGMRLQNLRFVCLCHTEGFRHTQLLWTIHLDRWFSSTCMVHLQPYFNKCKALSTDCNVIWVDTNHHLHSHFWLRKLSKNRCYIHVAVRLPHPFIQGIVQSLNFTHISLWTDLCSQSAPETTELITSYGSYLKGTLVE